MDLRRQNGIKRFMKKLIIDQHFSIRITFGVAVIKGIRDNTDIIDRLLHFAN